MELAVIETGGKQYIVSPGNEITIEKISVQKSTPGAKDFVVGDKVTFDKVLLKKEGENVSFGTPFLDKAKVAGTITEIDKADKVTVIKYKAKSNYFKKRGHRQPYFKVKIDSLS